MNGNGVSKPTESATGWRRGSEAASLSEVNRSIPVPQGLSFWRKMLAFSGPGYLVAVGYMDPGNWATDLAEVIGSAIALNLLVGLPLVWGVCLTALDVLAVMYLQNKGFRHIEALVVTLILTIGGCFGLEIVFSKPELGGVLSGFVPTWGIVKNPDMLYVAIGILGATVMPHNLYLHSSIVQTRKYEEDPEGKAEAIRFATLDSTVALTFALFINAAILIVSAATFYRQGQHNVAAIQEAYKLLSPMVGVSVASVVFALALLASGQNSTLTGTLAGQIVMEGFLNLRLRPWLRRLITRLLAIVPAVICVAIYGESGTTKLLVFSQVILSLQLPFAVIPLVLFTSDRAKMGQFVNPRWLQVIAWIVAALIVVLNGKLLFDSLGLTPWMATLFA